jgi:hypothetical protein
MIIQGAFPGGRPHSTVLLNNRSDFVSIAESVQTVQALIRHPNNFVIQQKMNDFKMENFSRQTFQVNNGNNIKAYPINISRLNFSDPGSPLTDDVLQMCEGVFNKDLSDVKIHEGKSHAETIGSLAFTADNDIYFATGRYCLRTPQGQRLLGHELTHVIQQKEGRVKNPFGDNSAVIYDPRLETEAERMGLHIFKAFYENNNSGFNSVIQKMEEEDDNYDNDDYDGNWGNTATLRCYLTWIVKTKNKSQQQRLSIMSKTFYSGKQDGGIYFYQSKIYHGGPAFYDSEMKLVGWLYEALAGRRGFNPQNIYGDITITSDLGPCDDCKRAISWLRRIMPHVSIIVNYRMGPKTGGQTRKGIRTRYGYINASGQPGEWTYYV